MENPSGKFIRNLWVNFVSYEEFTRNSLPDTFEWKEKPTNAFAFIEDNGDDR